jgi:hypothetical protein
MVSLLVNLQGGKISMRKKKGAAYLHRYSLLAHTPEGGAVALALRLFVSL